VLPIYPVVIFHFIDLSTLNMCSSLYLDSTCTHKEEDIKIEIADIVARGLDLVGITPVQIPTPDGPLETLALPLPPVTAKAARRIKQMLLFMGEQSIEELILKPQSSSAN
jgi:hypothetical protein